MYSRMALLSCRSVGAATRARRRSNGGKVQRNFCNSRRSRSIPRPAPFLLPLPFIPALPIRPSRMPYADFEKPKGVPPVKEEEILVKSNRPGRRPASRFAWTDPKTGFKWCRYPRCRFYVQGKASVSSFSLPTSISLRFLTKRFVTF
jgi:hypothetical protein